MQTDNVTRKYLTIQWGESLEIDEALWRHPNGAVRVILLEFEVRKRRQHWVGRTVDPSSVIHVICRTHLDVGHHRKKTKIVVWISPPREAARRTRSPMTR